MSVNKKNITIVGFITIFGIGLFVVFFNIFSRQSVLKDNTASSSLVVIDKTENDQTAQQIVNIAPPVDTKVVEKSPEPEAVTSVPEVSDSDSEVTPPVPVTTQPAPTPVVATPPLVPVVSKPTTIYKDGTYSYALSYTVPKHTEKISGTITIANDIIIRVNNTNTGTNDESLEYQSDFQSEIQSAAVGKKLDSINLSSVGGASRTTDAFVQGITQVQSQAKS